MGVSVAAFSDLPFLHPGLLSLRVTDGRMSLEGDSVYHCGPHITPPPLPLRAFSSKSTCALFAWAAPLGFWEQE